MKTKREPTIMEWCLQRGVSYWSAGAEIERERRRKRDEEREALERAQREELDVTSSTPILDACKRRLAAAEAADRTSTPAPTTTTTPAPAPKTTPRRVISTKMARYAGLDVKESVVDVGGIRFFIRECPEWKRPWVERLGEGSPCRRDHTALASYQEEHRGEE